MKKIAYYITAHGYGHGARSCDILNALREAAPNVPIIVKTDLPYDFMASRLPDSIDVRPGAFDLGLIQKDSIQVDLDASIETIAKLYEREEELIAQEAVFIERENVGVAVADIPAIPLAAAQRAGIPNIATGNFGWDWIYSEFVGHDPRWSIYIEKFRAVYAKTDLLLRQPFAEPMAAFPNSIDLPLLAKPGTGCRLRIAEKTGADPGKPWVLLSFTSLNLDARALERISHLGGYEFFSVEPLEWPDTKIHCLSRSLVPFTDYVASCDIVVTKPGFGIVSECIANNKPIVYSDRENFLEYPILVEAIERYCRQSFIPNAELYAGDFQRALAEVESAPEPADRMARGGAERAAQEILSMLR
jgi:L-arabinokinase